MMCYKRFVGKPVVKKIQHQASGPVGIREESLILRCKKCRRCVVDSSCLLSTSAEAGCTVWHVDVDALPDWILSVINQVHWTTGKLNCQHCGARLGGFNLLNCSRCPCGHDTNVHFIKSRVDQVVKHLVYLSRPGTARVHTGFQVKPRDLEGPEDRTLGGDPHQVTTNGLNPEPELLSRQIQAPHFDGEPSVISPHSPHLSLPLIRPVNEEVKEAAAHDPDRNARLTPTELSDYLENQDVPVDSFSAPTQNTVTGEPDLSDSVTEEPQDRPCSTPVQMLTKRERNRLKSLRRKQRKKERWIQRQLEEKSVSWNQSSSDEEEKEGCMCAVCLDVYYKPYMCQPCSHVFCEPCLRTLAKSRASSTPCPLCRTLISHVIFQEELHQHTRSHFPKEYCMRNETFQKTNYSKWPLPSCPKHFHILWGLQRHRASAGQWQFPLRTLGLNILELGDMRGWTFQSDMVTFIFSFHWVLSTFIVLCGLFYILLW
ncbi:E3 ubiquitin-protein ligase RNF180 isoform X2 [Hemibagrus wyckioides]|uniref:E3 ubiquitin-protein ligase RNF180 isoform X2 n=1 Tax=Hemibagrus wyckioides TaxID=337641 RepID=UPI00266D99EE|nr:E3 ubiquitin-protein ligase RNF180 isoform X2 [Hemibagrus wyckioides]